MLLFRALFLLAGLCLASASPAQGGSQPQPISPIGLAELLSRPLPGKLSVPRTRGHIALKGLAFYIAEYRVLVDQAGELPATPQGGQLLGRPVAGDEALLAYHSQPDIATLQALVDRAWDDLHERLHAAGITTEADDEITSEHGAVFEATEAASSPGAPVLVEARAGDTLRRYLTLAPTGHRLSRQAPGSEGPGNDAARARFRAANVEGLSLALAVNLSALEAGGTRRSSYTAPPGAEALSPLMELRPAPGAALVYAHAQNAQVDLGEAFVLSTEFARLRAAEPRDDSRQRAIAGAGAGAGATAGNALDKLISAVGKALSGGQAASQPAAGPAERPRVQAELELDGVPTARLLMYSFGAANQAIVDALKAARGDTP